MNCNGDQQDPAYFFLLPLPLDSGEVSTVVDTCNATGNTATGMFAVAFHD